MREFVLRALKARSDPHFDITDLPSAGRMDVVCRCISNALFISNDVRRDTIFHVVFDGPSNPPKTVSFYGDSVKDLYFDELSIAKTLRKALSKKLEKDKIIESAPGVFVQKLGFEPLVSLKIKTHQLIYLHEKGADIRSVLLKKDLLFVFGDYIGMPKKTEVFLDNLGALRVSISPIMLFASHTITIVHNELDRRSF